MAALVLASCGSDVVDPPASNHVKQSLTVVVEGSGSVVSSPAGIAVSGGSSPATASFPRGAVVTLTAEPAPGWEIQRWGGACAGVAAATAHCLLTLTSDRQATVEFSPASAPPEELTPGVPISGLSGAAGSERHFRLALGSAATGSSATAPTDPEPDHDALAAAHAQLTVALSGGTGDADLYLRHGNTPTPAQFDCRSNLPGNAETCTIQDPADGEWFVLVYGAAAYSGVTLSASVTELPDPPVQRTLTVSKTGLGTVGSDPEGIEIGVEGASDDASFDDGTVVTLTATPSAGWEIAAWGGACAETVASSPTCEVPMSDDRSVTVTFAEIPPEPPVRRTLIVSKTGLGTVGSDPAGIEIGAEGASDDASFDDGTVVTLTASPSAGWEIAGWGGACAGTAASSPSCEVAMTEDRSVIVTFAELPPEPPVQRTLTVSKTGLGTVVSDPAGIEIGAAGTSDDASFDDGTVVTLTATPSAGWEIGSWGGACAGTAASSSTCQIAMSGDRSATVTFAEIPPPQVFIDTRLIPGGYAGTLYDYSIAAFGGDGIYEFTVVAGDLPAGLSLDSETGRISGTPSAPGTSHFTIQVESGGATSSADYTLTVSNNGPGGFNIWSYNAVPVPPAVQAHVDEALARWEGVITADQIPGGVTIPEGFLPPGSCGGLGFAANGAFIDDLLVLIEIAPIDGPSGVLGFAGSCVYYGAMPVIGILRLDIEDLASRIGTSTLTDIVLHEIGHILGISAGHWIPRGFIDNPSCTDTCDPNPAIPPTYTGSVGVSEYHGYGGSGGVPLEHNGSPGTADSHWKESVFVNELMTGFISQTGLPNPLSRVTIGALVDLGWQGVHLNAADPYTLPSPLAEAHGAAREGTDWIHLGDDVYRGPVWVLHPDGRRDVVPWGGR